MARIFYDWDDTTELSHILGIYFQSIVGSIWNLPVPGMQEIIAAPCRPIVRVISLAYHSPATKKKKKRKKAKGWWGAGMVTQVYTIPQWLKKLPQKVLIQEVWAKHSLKTKEKTGGTPLMSPTYKASTSMHVCRNTVTCNTVHIIFRIYLHTYRDKGLNNMLCNCNQAVKSAWFGRLK